MKRTTLLIAVMTVVCGGAAAEAQVYVQPANYYANSAYANGTYTNSAYGVPQPVYAPPAYTPVTTYYAGSACGQAVPCSYNCCSPCACSPCGANYAPASPYMPQAVYAPVTYAPAPAACGPAPMCGPQAFIRRGSLGQPTVYVPGQPVRNFFRFFAL